MMAVMKKMWKYDECENVLMPRHGGGTRIFMMVVMKKMWKYV